MIRLTGPHRAIVASDGFQITMDLWGEYSDLYRSEDEDDYDKSGQFEIDWNVYHPFNTYNELKFARIMSKYGEMTVNYVVMSHAAEALVEIILINADGEDSADVYGTITAHDSMNDIQVFRRGVEEAIKVTPKNAMKISPENASPKETAIPLLRSAIAVPMDRRLQIGGIVWDHHSNFFPDKVIAQGTYHIDPQIFWLQQSVNERGVRRD